MHYVELLAALKLESFIAECPGLLPLIKEQASNWLIENELGKLEFRDGVREVIDRILDRQS
ncbi:hypothetical protein [Chromobacterium haemolyticum]|uniref:hypothetical protein n=1 Tax=Chromobacterium TaxID=535 RepID=UPI0040569265